MGMSILELYMANSIDNTAGKIREKLNTVRNKRKVSAKRCIWEMMQNAKDVYNPKFGGVSIEFEISDEHTFIFRHNGLPFGLKDVTCLIQQVSSKSSTNEDENVTGMFGTGFISTHLIADVIDVKSILIDFNDKYRYFNLKLDRSGSSKEELSPRIKEAMTEFAKLDKDSEGVLFPFVQDYEQHTENDFDTSFTYRIESESQLQLALLGINDLVNTLPVTMINLPTVKSVRVINRLEGTDFCYTCSREKKDENVILSTISNGELTKKYLTYTTSEVSLSIEIKEENGALYAVKRDEKLPVLLRDFPLIGSNQFYFPYFLNGFRFIPTEPRDDIQIHGDSDDKPSVINRDIIENAIKTALKFNQWLINHDIHNRYLLASSRIPKSTEAWDEETSEPWIKQLQKKWRAELLKQALVESEDGIYTMSEMVLPDCPKKESREKFWDILRPVEKRILPNKEDIHEWREIMVEYDSWNCTIKYSIEDFLKELACKTNISWVYEKFDKDKNSAFAWLNKVIKFTFEELGSDAFEKYSILPNQNGDFKKASELRRDNAMPIPSEIKHVYHIAFEQNVEDKLLNSSIDVMYVTSIKEYDLKSIIADLNQFIKDSNKKYDNRRDTSYALTQLYSIDGTKERRKNMNYICSAFTPKVTTFTRLNNVPDDLWTESDRFILGIIPYWITEDAKCTSLSMLGKEFLSQLENKDESKIIEWLNLYLKICSDVQCTSQLPNYPIFPNQEGILKKIGELSYDNNIPEEIKDLSEIADTKIKWRSSLLDQRIDGYSSHSPKNTSDIYSSISDTFDTSTHQLLIAKHAIALNCNNNPDVSYIYSVMNKLYNDMPVTKALNCANGFDWEKFIACAIVGISGEIAEKTNLKNLCCYLSTEDNSFDTKGCIAWVDRFLTFALNYRGGRYKNKVTELDNHGIWVNQSGNFSMFSTLSRDGGIAEPLKDLAANNPIVNFNYRDILIHKYSVMSSAIDSNKVITQKDILTKIDKALEEYKQDKQTPEFRSLIFGIMELDKRLHIAEQMKYYNEKKDTLIVGSLGEGETMNMVASIIQQGDDKIKAIKQILEENSLEDLNNVKEVIKGYSPIKLKDLVEKLSQNQVPIMDGETPTGGEDKVETKIETVPKIYDYNVEVWENGNFVTKSVPTNQVQYAGLSLQEIENYIEEAKGAVVKYFRELNDKNPHLGLHFDKERIGKHSYSQLYGIFDKYGKELPIVVHSYKGPQYRYFDLNWYDWQMLSQEGAMLFVLTVTGLQCIPLYALPVRNFNISINNDMSNETRAALLTLAAVGKKYSTLSFDFGNNMPQGFNDPLPFDYVPEQLSKCITSIKDVCDQNIRQIANLYNNGKNIPLVRSSVGYSLAMKEVEDGNARDIFDAPANDTQAPIVGTSFID